MRRWSCLIVFLILLAFLGGCTGSIQKKEETIIPTSSMPNDKVANPILMVNGKAVEDVNVIIFRTYEGEHTPPFAIIPLTAVLNAMNYSVKWKDEYEAEIQILGNDYLLSMKDQTLCMEGDNFNVICPPPGGIGYVFSGYQELYIDDGSLGTVLREVGLLGHVAANWDTQCVYVAITGVRSSEAY